jgi:hypothetical protein
MKVFSLIFILIAFNVSAQSDSFLKRHSLTVSPLSVTLHKKIFFGHSLKYRFNISDKMFAEVSTDGTIFRKLDPMKNSWYSSKFTPNLNQSYLIFGRTATLGTTDKSKKNKIGGFGGIHYLQHPSENNGYWIIDSTEIGGHRTITGFKTYSLIAGIHYQKTNFERRDDKLILKNQHNLDISYIFGVDLSFSGIIDNYPQYDEVEIPNEFSFKRSGGKIAYSFQRRLSKSFNIFFGVEYLWSPFIEYSPNKDIFVPRGSEKIFPSFLNVKIGLTFLK